MQECFPTELVTQPEIITPGSQLGDRAEYYLQKLARRGATVAVGLSSDVLPMVQTIASEPKVAEYCPGDAGDIRGNNGRFDTIDHAQRWVKKGRGFVGIYSADDELLAYGWSGREQNRILPDAGVTTAYRVGSSGSRLARIMRSEGCEVDFSMGIALGELIIATAVQLHGVRPGEISLETWESNQPARALYDRLGFGLRKVMRPELRPTLDLSLHPDGKIVDRRCHYQLVKHPLIEQDNLIQSETAK